MRMHITSILVRVDAPLQNTAMILCFGDKFELSERIGSGSFGEIFFTRNVKTGEDLATKLEKIKNKKASSQLRREAKIYLMLNGTGNEQLIKIFTQPPLT